MKSIQFFKKGYYNGNEVNVYGTIENPLFLASEIKDFVGATKISDMLKTVNDSDKLNILSVLESPIKKKTVYNGKAEKASNRWFLTQKGLNHLLIERRANDFLKFAKSVLFCNVESKQPKYNYCLTN